MYTIYQFYVYFRVYIILHINLLLLITQCTLLKFTKCSHIILSLIIILLLIDIVHTSSKTSALSTTYCLSIKIFI